MFRLLVVRVAMLVVLVAPALAFATSCVPAAKKSTLSPRIAQPTLTPTRRTGPDPRVGAVFLGSQTLHECSGSVLDSPGGDLVLTAAHCLADGFDAYFVPGFADDADQSDYWRIDAVYLDKRWLDDQNPLADFAIARVSRSSGDTVEARAGGFRLGGIPKDGTDIAVSGYAGGEGGEQLGCHARATTNRGYPALPCAGLVDGTSGSPWLAGSVVTGIVGGLDGGGCEEDVSYSPPFDDAVQNLLRRAEAGGPGDAAPTNYVSNC